MLCNRNTRHGIHAPYIRAFCNSHACSILTPTITLPDNTYLVLASSSDLLALQNMRFEGMMPSSAFRILPRRH